MTQYKLKNQHKGLPAGTVITKSEDGSCYYCERSITEDPVLGFMFRGTPFEDKIVIEHRFATIAVESMPNIFEPVQKEAMQGPTKEDSKEQSDNKPKPFVWDEELATLFAKFYETKFLQQESIEGVMAEFKHYVSHGKTDFIRQAIEKYKVNFEAFKKRIYAH